MNILRALNILDVVFIVVVVAFFSYAPLRRYFFDSIKMSYRRINSWFKDILFDHHLKTKGIRKEDRLAVKNLSKSVRQEIELVETKYGADYNINDPGVLWSLINDPKVPQEDKEILTKAYRAIKKVKG